MYKHYIMECDNCKDYKMISEKLNEGDVKCSCGNKKLTLYGLFNDGKIFKYNLVKR